ncbi:unnamed protein product [Orchesella dallaii]|uniref:Uncharacterized protein n=1 Tax=Orchesella dallaii TaxID=48710 RepID=A0ABP1QDK3_9HEXA
MRILFSSSPENNLSYSELLLKLHAKSKVEVDLPSVDKPKITSYSSFTTYCAAGDRDHTSRKITRLAQHHTFCTPRYLASCLI